MSIVLEARRLTCGYHGSAVLRDISFAVEEGAFFGIIGPNGSGKTTLLRCLTRALPVSQGQVLFAGRESGLFPRKEFSRMVAFVPQDTVIQFPFTVREVVAMGRIPHVARLARYRSHDTAVCDEMLRLTDTAGLADKLVNELSAGERQRVLLARALAQEPRVLMLDEPTSHLDIGHQIHVLDLLASFNRQRGLTVVIIMHDLNLAGEYCSQLMMLHEQRVFALGEAKDVLTYQNLERVYRTVVVVEKNPLSKKPFVLLVPGAPKK